MSIATPSPPAPVAPTTAAATITPPQDPRRRAAAPPEKPAANSLRRWIAGAVVLGLVAVSFALDRGAWAVIPILFVLVVPFEKLFPRHKGQPLRRPELRTDIGFGLISPALNVVGVTVAVVVGVLSFAWVPGLLIRPFVAMIPAVAMPFVGLALFDMAVYWLHRWAHEVPLLWRFHSIHHSTEHLDWVSGLRTHPVDGALIAPPFIFLLAAGFSPEVTGVLTAVQIVTGIFLHANVRWRLRPLHKLIITPEFHHWHHTNEPEAINTNYSVFLPVWDLIFGTYFMPKDRRPSVYGVNEYVPAGIWPKLMHPFRGMDNPLSYLRHPKKGFRALRSVTRTIVSGVKASTLRPTHRRNRQPALG